MPTTRSLNIIAFSLFLSPFSFFPSSVHASTDPQYATSSATASILDTTPVVSPGDTTPPTIPILIRPSDGAHSSDNTVEFVWSMSSDPNGNTVTYTFYLNGVAKYLGISNIGNSAGVGYTASIDSGQIKLIPNDGYADGSYNWYVVASDPSNNSSTSTQWNLTIDTQAPIINVTDIDTYHSLTLSSNSPEAFEGLNFDINGSKDIEFVISSEPWSTITMQFLGQHNELVSTSSWPLDGSGTSYPHVTLLPGTYTLDISAYDKAGNTTALPTFTLTVLDSQITVPLPDIPGVPPDLSIKLPTSPTGTLPATVSQVTARLSTAYLLLALLAVGIGALLFAIWKKKPNIILSDLEGMPLTNTIVYHSIPTSISPFSAVYTTKYKPVSFSLTDSDLGRLHIPHLSRYSTLTIRTSTATHILSISRKAKLYKLAL